MNVHAQDVRPTPSRATRRPTPALRPPARPRSIGTAAGDNEMKKALWNPHTRQLVQVGGGSRRDSRARARTRTRSRARARAHAHATHTPRTRDHVHSPAPHVQDSLDGLIAAVPHLTRLNGYPEARPPSSQRAVENGRRPWSPPPVSFPLPTRPPKGPSMGPLLLLIPRTGQGGPGCTPRQIKSGSHQRRRQRPRARP